MTANESHEPIKHRQLTLSTNNMVANKDAWLRLAFVPVLVTTFPKQSSASACACACACGLEQRSDAAAPPSGQVTQMQRKGAA